MDRPWATNTAGNLVRTWRTRMTANVVIYQGSSPLWATNTGD